MHEIRKYKFDDIACLDVLFVVHRYHYKFVGLESVGVDRATIQDFSLRLQRRIEWTEESGQEVRSVTSGYTFREDQASQKEISA